MELIRFFCNYNKRCTLRGRLKKINFSGAAGLGVRHQLSVHKVSGSKPIYVFSGIITEDVA
jgi:hypothetical protein